MEELTKALSTLTCDDVQQPSPTDKKDKHDKRCVLSMENVNELNIEEFKYNDAFTKVCDVLLDEDTARKTAIKFVPVIPVKDWQEHCEWVYIFTCDKRVLKIGGTRTGLKNRTQSYLCGRPEFREKGTCSTTNYVIYKSFQALLEAGHVIEMWACRLQEHKIEVENIGIKCTVPVQTYHVFEAKMLEAYKQQKGAFPILSNNADKRFIG